MTGALAGICAGYLWSSRKEHVTSLEGEGSSWKKYVDGTGRMNRVRKATGVRAGEEEKRKNMGKGA